MPIRLIRALAGGVLALAPLLFAPAGAARAETAGSLTVVSWNVAHFYADRSHYENDHLARYARAPADLARLRAYAKALDADVILFQELDGAEAARMLLPDGYCVEASPRDNGNPLTSRQKLVVAFRAALASDASGCVPRVGWYLPLGLPGDHLRYGADFQLPLGRRTVRFLGVHLKSGCHAGPLDAYARLPADATDWARRAAKACARLARQIPPLVDWIEDRVREDVPFMVFGDFNRRFDGESARRDGSALWPILSDGDPIGQSLVRPTRFQVAPCWAGGRYRRFIDHFVMNERAAALVRLGSFAQRPYDAPFSGEEAMGHRLSDHCAIRITLDADPKAGS